MTGRGTDCAVPTLRTRGSPIRASEWSPRLRSSSSSSAACRGPKSACCCRWRHTRGTASQQDSQETEGVPQGILRLGRLHVLRLQGRPVSPAITGTEVTAPKNQRRPCLHPGEVMVHSVGVGVQIPRGDGLRSTPQPTSLFLAESATAAAHRVAGGPDGPLSSGQTGRALPRLSPGSRALHPHERCSDLRKRTSSASAVGCTILD